MTTENDTDQTPPSKPTTAPVVIGCSDLLALTYIREIVGDDNHMLTNEELIDDIKTNYIKPVKRCKIPPHLRGEQLARKTIRERDNINLANMLSKAERELDELKNFIREEVVIEIYNPKGENEELLKKLHLYIS